MPTQNDISLEMADHQDSAADQIRRKYLKRLHKHTGHDVILYASGFTVRRFDGVPNALYSISTEDIQGMMSAMHGLKGNVLDLIIHSPGGSIEASMQLIKYLRSKYGRIRAIIPQNAMSAATIIACAADEIVMGKHSALGPIDPQVMLPFQRNVFPMPAQAILDEFQKAKEEVLANPGVASIWVNKLKDIPQGFFVHCQNILELAKDVVCEGLRDHMFQGETDGERKAREIADWLGNNAEQKAHGRPISASEASSRGLKVTMLESDQDLQEKVLSVFHSVVATFSRTPCVKLVENHSGKGTFYRFQ